MSTEKVTNIILAGLGGQGVVSASDILADAVFREGYDIKKSELHGMSQRGGTVSSDVRFGRQVWSPMIPDGEADFLVLLDEEHAASHTPRLKKGGCLIKPGDVDEKQLANRRSLNVALLGLLSSHLSISEETWQAALRARLPEHLYADNLNAFQQGRNAGASQKERQTLP